METPDGPGSRQTTQTRRMRIEVPVAGLDEWTELSYAARPGV